LLGILYAPDYVINAGGMINPPLREKAELAAATVRLEGSNRDKPDSLGSNIRSLT
jgi:glutamate dehydrogenase/leucine dehydrogenase